VAGRSSLLHVQKYLFQKCYVPASKVEIEYSGSGRLLSLRALNDEFEVKPPPFTVLPFNVEFSGDGCAVGGSTPPISKVAFFDEDLEVKMVLKGDEGHVVSSFSSVVLREDPDFLVSRSVEETLSKVIGRAEELGLTLQVGRETSCSPCRGRFPSSLHRGRVLLDLGTYLRIGLAGVVERARFTVTPPGLSAMWQAGRIIDSRQSFEALRRGVLLPERRASYIYGMTAREVASRDRGGLLFSPEVGLHENVGELDFESMFPKIIERFNLSYENVTPESVEATLEGFLGDVTRRFLDRRLYFKHLRGRYPRGSRMWLWCEQRQRALKGILVCIYGFSGCFANRFGNVAVYQEINRVARRVLLKAVDVAVREGYEVVYGDTDSLFLKRRDASREDYERLAEKISRETGLPIALDHHYRFLVFLNQTSMPEMGAARRYFGKLTNGELYYRGIDLRRHDTPPFLKDFQEELMRILFDASSAEEVETRQFKRACGFVEETCRKIRRGEVNPDELTVRKVLRKPLREYRSLLPHVVAAKHLTWKGKRLEGGENVGFLYVNASHRNPYRRVTPHLAGSRVYYDRERYVKLALDVAETILGVFGFQRRSEEADSKLTLWC